MKHKKKRLSAVACLLVMALLFSSAGNALPKPVQAATSAELEEELEELEKQKGEVDAEIAGLRQQISNTENDMLKKVQEKSIIDQEIGLLNKKVVLINDEITTLSLLIADKQDELDKAEAELKRLQEENKQRIRAMEKNGRFSYWSVLANANSFFDFLDRMYMINEIRAEDERRLQEMKDATAQVSAAKETLQDKQVELTATLKELDEMQVQLSQRRADADEVLLQLQADRDAFQALMEESEDKQNDLMISIAQKNEEIEDAKHREWLASQVNNGWRMPCEYWVLTSPFGPRVHPITGEVGKMHNGVDLAGPYGTPIYATRAGVVTTAAYEAGGAGWYVYINHGDGFGSIYMHMDHYTVYWGQQVQQGDIIGYLGSSGGSTGPHLHFGIWKNGVGYVNPALYINFY